jgi:hypothetical protein
MMKKLVPIGRFSAILFGLACGGAVLAADPDLARARALAFLEAARPSDRWDPASWVVSGDSHVRFVRGTDIGTALVRGSDSKVVAWTSPRLVPSAESPSRPEPDTYLTPETAGLLALQCAARLGHPELRVFDVVVTPDSQLPEGGTCIGQAVVRMQDPSDPPCVGRYRLGVSLVFDSATAELLSYRVLDRVQLVQEQARVATHAAIQTALAFAKSEWGIPSPKAGSVRLGWCVPMESWLESVPVGGELPDGGALKGFWCAEVEIASVRGAWVCVRLSDGKVIDAKSGGGD